MPDREPDDRDLENARRRLRTAIGFLQLGGIAFAAVVAIGLLPRIIAARAPGAMDALQLAAVSSAVLVAVGAVALGIARVRRLLKDPAPPPGDAAEPPSRAP